MSPRRGRRSRSWPTCPRWAMRRRGAGCAYRMVQESLSNASQHAPGAAVTVSVDGDGHAVLLRVANGPAGPGIGAAPRGPAGAAPSPPARPVGHGRAGNGLKAGHGLTGMRERVALLGGSLSAGPAPGGGFVVSARLPLGGASCPAAVAAGAAR